MSSEVTIEFGDGHADVWRLFDDAGQLREIAEALVEPFRGQVTKVVARARGALTAHSCHGV